MRPANPVRAIVAERKTFADFVFVFLAVCTQMQRLVFISHLRQMPSTISTPVSLPGPPIYHSSCSAAAATAAAAAAAAAAARCGNNLGLTME